MKKSKMFYGILIIFLSLLGLSYSIFISESKRVTAGEILVGNLLYGINIYEDNSYTPITGTAVTIPANSSKDYYVRVSSINPISSKFTLAYNNQNVVAEVSSRSGWNPSGGINEYSTNAYVKTIKVKITNNTSSSQTVNFAAYGGYSYNALASINLGNGYIAVQSVYSDVFLLEGNTLVNVVKDDTNCEATAVSPCLYGGDSVVNYFQFEEGGDTYRVIGNYVVNGEILTKIIGPASNNENINSSTTFAESEYLKIGGDESYLGADYSSLSVYYLNKDVIVVGSGTSNDKFTISEANDLNLYEYEYIGQESPEPSLATLKQGLGTTYVATVICSSGTTATIDNSGVITFTSISVPARCKIRFTDYTNYTINVTATNSEQGTISQNVIGDNQTEITITPSAGYTLTGATASCDSATPTVNVSTGKLIITNISSSQNCTITLPAKTLTVTFDANGGSGLTSSSKTVTYGETYGTLPTIDSSSSCGGYSFDGWYTSSSGGYKITSSSTVTTTTDQTLFAHRSYNGACCSSGTWAYDSCNSDGYVVEARDNGCTGNHETRTTTTACTTSTTCSSWSTCTSSGTQTRTCTYKYGGSTYNDTSYTTSQSCTYCDSSESTTINDYRCYNGVNTYIYSCQPTCNSNPTCNGGTINRQSLKAACPATTYTCSKAATAGCSGNWAVGTSQCYRTRSDLYSSSDDIGSWTSQLSCKQNCTTSGYSCTQTGTSTWWCRKPASCSGGATLVGSTCYEYKAYDSYTCDEGTLSGTTCYLYNQSSTKSGWSCTAN